MDWCVILNFPAPESGLLILDESMFQYVFWQFVVLSSKDRFNIVQPFDVPRFFVTLFQVCSVYGIEVIGMCRKL